MYTSPQAMWEGWTKNLYRGAGLLPPGLVPAGAVYLAVVLVSPYLALYQAWRRRSGALALAGTVQLLVNLILRRLTDATVGVPPRYTLAQPIGQAAALILLVASAWKVLTGRGVTWKGRRYYGPEGA
jgi:hypothetical protein